MTINTQSNFISLNEYSRLKASELALLLKQAKGLVPNHNPTIGYIGEEIFRIYFNRLLPKRFKATQGFVEYNGHLSPQCDIIIYDQLNFAPTYSFGNVDIIPSKAVVCIIEIKTRIDTKRLSQQLEHIEKIHAHRIQNTHIIIFNGPTLKSICNSFYHSESPAIKRLLSKKGISKSFCFGKEAYDVDDYVILPKTITILDRGYCLQKAYVQDNQNDYYGYAAYNIKDGDMKDISALQIITQIILEESECFEPDNNTVHPSIDGNKIENPNDLIHLTAFYQIPICSL